MIKLALFASGTGSNSDNIIRYFKGNSSVQIAVMISNNPNAGALQIANEASIPTQILSTDEVKDGNFICNLLKKYEVDFVVLAGYLKMIPAELTKNFPERIINIHPALLPKFGGKGMYGKHVHQAVAKAGESESGITIHFVNEEYDKGKIIAQKSVNLLPGSTAAEIELLVRQLEIEWFPKIIELTVLN